MMQLVWIDIIIFFLIAGAGVILSQRIYRQDMETETSNVFEASFSNIENTLHFVENIAFNIMNDKTVKEALRAVNQEREDRYALVDDLYYRLITGSLVANDAVSIIVTDLEGRQYATGSLDYNLTEEEQEKSGFSWRNALPERSRCGWNGGMARNCSMAGNSMTRRLGDTARWA